MERKDYPFKSFWGNDQDYGYPYRHRYDEPDSDRGASDECTYEKHFDAFYNNKKD